MYKDFTIFLDMEDKLDYFQDFFLFDILSTNWTNCLFYTVILKCIVNKEDFLKICNLYHIFQGMCQEFESADAVCSNRPLGLKINGFYLRNCAPTVPVLTHSLLFSIKISKCSMDLGVKSCAYQFGYSFFPDSEATIHSREINTTSLVYSLRKNKKK